MPKKKSSNNNTETKNKNTKKKKVNKKQIVIDLDKMSLQKKLFTLRETIDLVALGIPCNKEVIDRCYEDLLEGLQDYEWLQTEWDEHMKFMETMDAPVDDDLFNDYSIGSFEGETSSEIDSDTVIRTMSLQELTQQIYGDSWQKLEDGLDQLNEKYGTYYRVYMYPQMDGKTVKLKVFDDHDITLKRVYDDKYDLDINLEQDIKSNFTRPKISLSKLKLSNKKEENIE